MDISSYQKLRKLARLQQFKYSLLSLAVFGVTFLLFLLYREKTGGSFTDPSSIFFVLLLMIPFFFKFYRRIFERSWQGEVKYIRYPDSSERSGYLARSYTPSFLVSLKGDELCVVTVSTTALGTREIILIGNEAGLGDSYYRIGDKVQKFPGLKYPVNYTTDRPEIFCPVCGSFNRLTDSRCYDCKHPLIDPERKQLVPEKTI